MTGLITYNICEHGGIDMDNWNDYTLSTDEYTSSEPDPIPRDMHDMTATYDFTNMVEQAKSETDIRNAETAGNR